MKYTLKQMNEKIWYRFIKVLFILVIVGILLIGIWFFYNKDKGYYDENIGRVTCIFYSDSSKIEYFEIKLEDYKSDMGTEYNEKRIAEQVCGYSDFVDFGLSEDKTKAYPIIQGYLNDQTIPLEKRQKVIEALNAGQNEDELADMVIKKYRELPKATDVGINFSKMIDKIYKYDDIVISNTLFLATKGAYFDKLHLGNFIFHSILFILILGIVADIIRRTFLYIFTGSIK